MKFWIKASSEWISDNLWAVHILNLSTFAYVEWPWKNSIHRCLKVIRLIFEYDMWVRKLLFLLHILVDRNMTKLFSRDYRILILPKSRPRTNPIVSVDIFLYELYLQVRLMGLGSCHIKSSTLIKLMNMPCGRFMAIFVKSCSLNPWCTTENSRSYFFYVFTVFKIFRLFRRLKKSFWSRQRSNAPAFLTLYLKEKINLLLQDKINAHVPIYNISLFIYLVDLFSFLFQSSSVDMLRPWPLNFQDQIK